MKILGLDLGVSSIGWALIQEDKEKKDILAVGVRIIPLNTDDKNEFTSGNAITKNQKRTEKRSQRKGYDRYQQRRTKLLALLNSLGWYDEVKHTRITALELYGLRDKAVQQQINLKELGRILLHLNQKRGYKSAKADNTEDKKTSDYLKEIKDRYDLIQEQHITVGQYFYKLLLENPIAEIKNNVFPRHAYIEELDAIWEVQSRYYPELTPALKNTIKTEIIYYQRKLKSQKGLVSYCEFEKKKIQPVGSEKEITVGPKVAHKSNPLNQICKIWESINNIQVKNKMGDVFSLNVEKKQAIFSHLDNNLKLTNTELFKILGIKDKDNWYSNIKKELTGNTTKHKIYNILKNTEQVQLNINTIVSAKAIDLETGEIKEGEIISNNYDQEPLYKIWDVIYSINEEEIITQTLIKKFNIGQEEAKKLAKIDFNKEGYASKSTKAIRKILPYLQKGYQYSQACDIVGYNHSGSLTKEAALEKFVLNKIPLIKKNALRQPIVEKILNQMINLINALDDKYGKPDEIRIELARELKQSKDERNSTFRNINKAETENKAIAKRLEEEYGIRSTRKNIEKWKLYHEVDGLSVYTGKKVDLAGFLKGTVSDVEHIIPKSRLFDDSRANKTICESEINREKDNRTAYDYMQSKSKEEFVRFIETVNMLYKNNKISRAKRDKLLTPAQKIPKDFIDRQLRETQYIAKKAKEILQDYCLNVSSTSGGVTDYLRHQWGYDDILMNLRLPQFKEAGLTEMVERTDNQNITHKVEVIKGWTKRDDHRHHAIDAIVIACTKQGYIQRLNKLNQEVEKNTDANTNQLLKGYEPLKLYIQKHKPFTTQQIAEKVAQVLVSFKPGKKVAVKGIRKIKKDGKYITVQKNITVPKGSLSEESVYGKIKILEKEKPLKYIFENPHLIFKPYIKELVENRLEEFKQDVKKALTSLKSNPVYLDDDQQTELKYASCYKEEYVIKYSVESIKFKDLEYIIDPIVREKIEARLAEFENKEKEAFKDLQTNPIWYNEQLKIPIKTVRMQTGLGNLQPLHYSIDGKTYPLNNRKINTGTPINYVKPGNNHHLSIFEDEEGNYHGIMTSFWDAVERARQGFDSINKIHAQGYKFIMSLQQNEMFLYQSESVNTANSLKLYRLQKMSQEKTGSIRLYFRHHLETELIDTEESKTMKRFISVSSLKDLKKFTKVEIDRLGNMR
jgi:CRISPR-associated endonuclease Csn1